MALRVRLFAKVLLAPGGGTNGIFLNVEVGRALLIRYRWVAVAHTSGICVNSLRGIYRFMLTWQNKSR